LCDFLGHASLIAYVNHYIACLPTPTHNAAGKRARQRVGVRFLNAGKAFQFRPYSIDETIALAACARDPLLEILPDVVPLLPEILIEGVLFGDCFVHSRSRCCLLAALATFLIRRSGSVAARCRPLTALGALLIRRSDCVTSGIRPLTALAAFLICRSGSPASCCLLTAFDAFLIL
jgi:hypothetical protein